MILTPEQRSLLVSLLDAEITRTEALASTLLWPRLELLQRTRAALLEDTVRPDRLRLVDVLILITIAAWWFFQFVVEPLRR